MAVCVNHIFIPTNRKYADYQIKQAAAVTARTNK